ncbi:YqhA family protein, partial [Vibrio fluvialis]|nr:YqhA family protein [Vibrio fluvialis]
MENFVEKLLYSARWIMAPIYLGLSLVLLALGIKFFQEVFHLL